MSAIVIFLNAERWLAEALESVRAPTRDDWELLLVDDGLPTAPPPSPARPPRATPTACATSSTPAIAIGA